MAIQSARITNEPSTAPLRLPDTSETVKEKLSGSGYFEQVSGSGYKLPDAEHLQWESNGKGGFEAWHSPAGVNHRKGKTYLGFLGKRKVTLWRNQTPAEFQRLVYEWIAAKRTEKGIG